MSHKIGLLNKRIFAAYIFIFIAACAPKQTGGLHDKVDPQYVDDTAILVDKSRQTYRFEDGICRQLGNIPKPWRLASNPYNPDYGWNPISPSSVVLEADNNSFGIAPPGGRRSGRDQELVQILIISSGLADEEHKARRSLDNPTRWGPETTSYLPISDSFRTYTDLGNGLIYINENIKAVFVNTEGEFEYKMPNITIRGAILLSSDETATVRMSFESLVKLQEISESIIKLSHDLRVACPTREPT